MTKILKSLQFVTQSNPSTPNVGTGALFASASSLYFENSTGVTYDLAASNGRIVAQSYTGSTTGADVTYTWTKLPSLKYLEICCIGGGGGGASGRVTATNAQLPSSGGGGGAIVYQLIEAARLNSSYTITVGAGGTPGAARVGTGSALIGLTGSNGGDTSFGTLVVAKGGDGGSVTAAFTFGGDAQACTPSYGPWVIGGCTSGYMTTTTRTDAPAIFRALPTTAAPGVNAGFTSARSFGYGGGGGGVGGGLVSSVPTDGSSGSGVFPLPGGSTIGGGAGGLGSSTAAGGIGTNGLNNQVPTNRILHFSGSINLGIYGLGTGGGGGGSGRTAGGNGGNAGYYGAGGGGGGQLFGLGSVAAPSSSGAGGSGSSGLCLLIEYY